MAGPLGVPQPGETQQTVIGDIVWTLLEGDASTQPEMVSAVIDGVYYGVENGGQGTWRSPDGIEWELTDLTPNGIVGIFEIDGESWARRSTLDGHGLGRWNGEEFAPVELPTPLAPQIEGLRSMPGFAPNPVQVGDEWIVPVTTRLAIPWNEWYPAEGEPEWDVVTETIRIMDYSSGAPTPLAVIDVDIIASDPARIEFRDSETDEVVVDVVVPAGDDPEELRQQLVAQGGSSFHELLIGDGNGFEAVASPSPFAESLRYAVVGDTVLAVASYPFDQQGRRSQPEELWASTDGRNWERRELPTPSGSRVDWVDIAADGSVALLTIVSGDDTSQGSEAWSSVDGLDWVPTEEDHGFDSPRPTELGWLRGDLYETGGISVSSDGLTWQSIDFDVRPPGGPGGGGANVFGDTIFVATHEGGERTMWVGKIVDR